MNEWISEASNWSNIQTVIEVERERHFKGEVVQQETLYYISSLAPDVERIGKAIRSHWEWKAPIGSLDVTFKEDDCRIRNGDGAENVAVIRRFALNLTKLHPQKNSMRGKLKQAGWSDKFRSELIFGQN
ncbi:MAG: ISAs1 family transposase [Enterobacterales bacterium]|nr:ISAs1 family transposase [Enterobacterales bacterium]